MESSARPDNPGGIQSPVVATDPAYLTGIRVVEISDGDVGSAYAGRLLVQLGAAVVCVEPPGGSPLRSIGAFPSGRIDRESSAAFVALNAGKRSVTLALGTPTGQSTLDGLLKKADVLIFGDNTRRRSECHLAKAELARRHPDLIVACTSPFGVDGEWSSWRAADIEVAAAGGTMIGMGKSERPPLSLPRNIASVQAGIVSTLGIITALLGRELHGVAGDFIDASAVDVWSTIHHPNISNLLYTGLSGSRRGRRHGATFPSAVYRCKDGLVVTDVLQIEQWLRFVEMMGTPEWTKNPRYRDRRAMAHDYPEEVDPLMEEWLVQFSREELWAMARRYKVPMAPVYTLDEVTTQPQLLFRQFFVRVDCNGDVLTLPGLPFVSSSQPPGPLRSPSVGEHNAVLLEGELGISREDRILMTATAIS